MSVPKPVKNTIYSLSWRRDDALKENALKKNYAVGPTTTRLLVAPAAKAGVGTARTTFLWTLVEPTAVPTYSYTVALAPMASRRRRSTPSRPRIWPR